MGDQDYDLHQKTQIEMIGNVFYNMLTMIGNSSRDPKF